MLTRPSLIAALLLGGSLAACTDDTVGSGGAGAGGGSAGGPQLGCGDGFADPDLAEECDDGNLDDADECLNDCTLAKCGDGVIRAGLEDCDDQNSDDSDACVQGCLEASCGDGFTHVGAEDCDDGNEEDGDACTSACTAGAGCGNGTVDAGEDCDDGNRDAQDACIDCVAAACGDGSAQLGVEDCDDGNDVDDDTCSNACTVNVPEDYGCPGQSLSVAVGPSGITVGGNTSDAAPGAYEGSCGGEESAEFVYALTPDADGLLSIELLAINDDYDPVLYVKADCEGASTLHCADATYSGDAETLSFEAQGGTTYYVFADGWGATAGEFLLGATLFAEVPGDDCPGLNIPLSDYNDPYSVSGNTAAANADRVGTGLCNSPGTNEIVYRVVAPLTGKLVVALDPAYDASLYVRSQCTTPSSQLVCSEMGDVGGLELTNTPVTAGSAYYVFVDGYDGDEGSFNVEFTLIP